MSSFYGQPYASCPSGSSVAGKVSLIFTSVTPTDFFLLFLGAVMPHYAVFKEIYPC